MWAGMHERELDLLYDGVDLRGAFSRSGGIVGNESNVYYIDAADRAPVGRDREGICRGVVKLGPGNSVKDQEIVGTIGYMEEIPAVILRVAIMVPCE